MYPYQLSLPDGEEIMLAVGNFLIGQKALSISFFWRRTSRCKKNQIWKWIYGITKISYIKMIGNVALSIAVVLPHLAIFCNFSFPSYVHFSEADFFWMSKTSKEADPHFSSTPDIISLHCTSSHNLNTRISSPTNRVCFESVLDWSSSQEIAWPPGPWPEQTTKILSVIWIGDILSYIILPLWFGVEKSRFHFGRISLLAKRYLIDRDDLNTGSGVTIIVSKNRFLFKMLITFEPKVCNKMKYKKN